MSFNDVIQVPHENKWAPDQPRDAQGRFGVSGEAGGPPGRPFAVLDTGMGSAVPVSFHPTYARAQAEALQRNRADAIHQSLFPGQANAAMIRDKLFPGRENAASIMDKLFPGRERAASIRRKLGLG
jgi:hypothetical protein